MELGLGLPVSDPPRLLDWARRAEAAGFASVALLDRLAYDNPEPLVALALLAGATTRIRLQTEVLLAPLRGTALLAKQAATLQLMSGGRFRLGVGVGGRADDHAAAGVPLSQRGAVMDRMLGDLRAIWGGAPYPTTPIGPSAAPPLLIGGFAPAALARVARFEAGFLCAAPLQWAGKLVDTVQEQWRAAGRAGRPRLVCQVNAATPASLDRARGAAAAYYAFTGREGWGEPISDPGQLAETVAAYREFGADELILYCWGDDPGQIELLARHAKLS
ncbi:LLM class flavin-dependent oxidoreductase [Dactylosporangium sp. CS-047395]|uniref:LLM class flavin-dependent oxidoreductase n=1 Tax=Dactylosporangium sp. CS-047395 TaxID=3239936 RepID=UPI003D8A9108